MELEAILAVVFLDQASIGGAEMYLTDFSKDIYSSPEFGVQEYLEKRLLLAKQ